MGFPMGFIAMAASLLNFVGLGPDAPLQLVKNGEPRAEIILGENPTKGAQLGAYELRHHVKLITGTELPIAAKPSGKLPVRIFVGTTPDGKAEKMSGEVISRKFSANDIVLTGNDTTPRGKIDYGDYTTFVQIDPAEFYGYNGPVFAVYDFLEDLCGVRFFWMDEHGTVYSKRDTLTVERKDRVHTPRVDGFRLIYADGSLLASPEQEALKKMPSRNRVLWRLRWRMMSCFGPQNHNCMSIYYAHWDKAKDAALSKAFISKSPELFAQGYKGKGASVTDSFLQGCYPNDKDLPPQLCFTNPGTAKYFAGEVLTYYNGKNVLGGWGNARGRVSPDVTLLPRFEGKPFFYPLQDLDNSQFCQCENCLKRNEGKTANASNSKFQFISDVANEAAKTTKDAGVGTLAYAGTFRYPDKVELADNISVQLCVPFYTWWHPAAYRVQHAAYKEWMDKEAGKRPMTLWTYIFSTYWDSQFHFQKYNCFPGFYPWKVAEIFREFIQDGVRGNFSEVQFQYNSLEAYVVSRLTYDTDTDADALIDDYFEKCYGKAADSMKEFFRESENAYWDPKNCPPEWLDDPEQVIGPKGKRPPFWCTGLISPEIGWGKMGTDARMRKMSSLLEKAGKEVDTPVGKFMFERMEEIWADALKGKAEYEKGKNAKPGKDRSKERPDDYRM